MLRRIIQTDVEVGGIDQAGGALINLLQHLVHGQLRTQRLRQVEERRLFFGAALRFLEQSRVFNGRGDLAGHDAQRVDVVVGEGRQLRRLDGERADDLAAADQRERHFRSGARQ